MELALLQFAQQESSAAHVDSRSDSGLPRCPRHVRFTFSIATKQQTSSEVAKGQRRTQILQLLSASKASQHFSVDATVLEDPTDILTRSHRVVDQSTIPHDKAAAHQSLRDLPLELSGLINRVAGAGADIFPRV